MVQARENIDTTPFILAGFPVSETRIIAQDAGRTTDMAYGTVMVMDPATLKLEPFTDETAVDGTEKPIGILLETLATADIVAGDIADIPILVGGDAYVDQNKLVIENSKTLDTVITTLKVTVRQALKYANIYVEDTVSIDAFENA
jgi:hypothetical protein